MRRHIRILSILALLASAVACDESLSDIAGPSTPDLEPTFESIQRLIFETPEVGGRKNCTACHNNIGRVPAAGMNLLHDVAYDQIVNVASTLKPGAVRVVPGNAAASYMVHKVEIHPTCASAPSDPQCINGGRMPLTGPVYLTEGQILILKRWIDIGAPRN